MWLKAIFPGVLNMEITAGQQDFEFVSPSCCSRVVLNPITFVISHIDAEAKGNLV